MITRPLLTSALEWSPENRTELADLQEGLASLNHRNQHAVPSKAQEIVGHWAFERGKFVALFFYMIWIGVDAELNHEDLLYMAPWYVQIVSWVFCAWFVFEFVMTLCTVKDMQLLQMFESGIMVCLVWETCGTFLVFRVVGLNADIGPWTLWCLRTFQLVRIIGYVLRLWLNVPMFVRFARGIIARLEYLTMSLFLLVCVIFIFSIILIKYKTKDQDSCFEGLLHAMHCLIKQGVFADQMDIVQQFFDQDWTSYWTFMFFLLFGSFTTNLLFIGACCDVLNLGIATEYKYRSTREQEEQIDRILQEVNADGNHMISIHEFKELCESEHAEIMMKAMKIDVQDLWDLGPFIFFEIDEIEIELMREYLLKLRGDSEITVQDIVTTRKVILEELAKRIPEKRKSEIFNSKLTSRRVSEVDF